jgi:hypothetical protein
MREGAADMSSTVSDQIFTLAGSMSNRNSTGGEPARGHQAPCREVRPLQQGMPTTGRSGVGYVALDALSYDGAQQLIGARGLSESHDADVLSILSRLLQAIQELPVDFVGPLEEGGLVAR